MESISNYLNRIKRGYEVHSRSAWNKSNPKKGSFRYRRLRYNQTKFTTQEHEFMKYLTFLFILVFSIFIVVYPSYFIFFMGSFFIILYLVEFWIVGKEKTSYKKKAHFSKR